MPLSPDDNLSTPANYASPNQIAASREYAKYLMQGSGQQPVHHWAQGLSNMVGALIGGNKLYQSGQQETANMQEAGKNTQWDPNDPSAPPAYNAQPGLQATTGAPSGSTQAGMDPYDSRVAKLESSGNPNNITGHQYGLVQMGKTELQKYGITDWRDPNQQIAGLHQERAGNAQALAKALGRPPTPGEEYLAHQQGLAGAIAEITHPDMPAWQAIRPYYNSDAIAQKAIAGNPPGGGHVDPNMPAGAFANAWISQFNRGMPHQGVQGGQTADASGSIGGTGAAPSGPPPTTGSPELMAQALTARSPAGGAVPGNAPAPTSPGGGPNVMAAPGQGQQLINPAVIPKLPQVTRQQMEYAFGRGAPYVPDWQRQQMMKDYLAQGQPQQFGYPGGSVSVGRGGQQQYFPAIQEEKLGTPTGEVPRTFTITPQGTKKYTPVEGAGSGGQSEAPTSSAPPNLFQFGKPSPASSGAAPGAPAVPSGPKPQSAIPSDEPAMASAEPQGAEPQIPQGKLAGATAYAPSNDTASDAPPPGAGPPPSMLSSQPPQTAEAAPKPPAGPQVAQNSSYLDPYTAGIIKENSQRKIELEGGIESNKKAAETFAGSYKAGQEVSRAARSNISELALARKLAEDPNFIAGVFADGRLDLLKLAAWVGKNPDAARPTEIFKKIMAGQTLGELKSSLGGWAGQVRLAEFQTVATSLASTANTPEAAKAVLDIMMKVHQRAANIGQLQNWYAQGWRWDDQGNPHQSGAKGLDYGWDETLQKFTDNNPIISDSDIKNYDKIFGSNIDKKKYKANMKALGAPGADEVTPTGTPPKGKSPQAQPPVPYPPGFGPPPGQR